MLAETTRETSADGILRILRALADPTRLRILNLCHRAEHSAGELVQILGQSQPRVSRHLKVLVDAGLLARKQEGNRAFYRPTDEGDGLAVGGAILDRLPAEDPAVRRDLERLETVRAERAARARAYFRKSSARWREIRALYVDEARVEATLLALLEPAPIRRLLDIGTGTGRMLELLGPRAERGLGIDLSPEMLELARVNLERAGLEHCQVRKADMNRLPEEGGPFDVVTVHMVLHFAEQPGRVLAEAARVMAPGGRLVVVDFAPHDLEALRRDHAHAWLGFSDREIARWLEAAGLAPEAPVHLEGTPLTVCLWPAAKPAI